LARIVSYASVLILVREASDDPTFGAPNHDQSCV